MTLADLKRMLAIFPWDQWREDYRVKFGPLYGALIELGGQKGAAAVGGDFDAGSEVQAYTDRYVGERIVTLDETTKDDVGRLIERVWLDGQEAEGGGPTPFELGTILRDEIRARVGDGYARWRADRIARTESAIGFNTGTLFGYQQHGIEQVEVSDGDDDEACQEVDGQIWTIEQAMAEPTAHPNCVRSFSPVVDTEAAQEAA